MRPEEGLLVHMRLFRTQDLLLRLLLGLLLRLSLGWLGRQRLLQLLLSRLVLLCLLYRAHSRLWYFLRLASPVLRRRRLRRLSALQGLCAQGLLLLRVLCWLLAVAVRGRVRCRRYTCGRHRLGLRSLLQLTLLLLHPGLMLLILLLGLLKMGLRDLLGLLMLRLLLLLILRLLLVLLLLVLLHLLWVLPLLLRLRLVLGHGWFLSVWRREAARASGLRVGFAAGSSAWMNRRAVEEQKRE